jgi:hypothetical protein
MDQPHREPHPVLRSEPRPFSPVRRVSEASLDAVRDLLLDNDGADEGVKMFGRVAGGEDEDVGEAADGQIKKGSVSKIKEKDGG